MITINSSQQLMMQNLIQQPMTGVPESMAKQDLMNSASYNMMKSRNSFTRESKDYQQNMNAFLLVNQFYIQNQFKINRVSTYSNFRNQIYDLLFKIQYDLRKFQQQMDRHVEIDRKRQNPNIPIQTMALAMQYKFLWRLLPRIYRQSFQNKLKYQNENQQRQKKQNKNNLQNSSNIQIQILKILKSLVDIKKLQKQNKWARQQQKQNEQQGVHIFKSQRTLSEKRLQYRSCIQQLYLAQSTNMMRQQPNAANAQMPGIAGIKTIDLFQKIFKGITYTVYLPSMLKVDIAGINNVDKEKSLADIAIRVQIRVNVPGYSADPQFYKNIFDKMKIKLKNEDLDKLYDINIDLGQEQQQDNESDRNIKARYFQPKTYFNTEYNWENYKMPGSKGINKLQLFQGFILLLQVKNLTVKFQPRDFTSPLEILDLKGIVDIQPIKIDFQKISKHLYKNKINDIQSRHFINANPEIEFKFNLISLYFQKMNDFSQLILCNHISNLGHLSKQDYHLAPKLMVLQISNASRSQIELKSWNPFDVGWQKREANEKLIQFDFQQKEKYSVQTRIPLNSNEVTKIMLEIQKQLRDFRTRGVYNQQFLLDYSKIFKRLFFKLNAQTDTIRIQQTKSRIQILQSIQFFIQEIVKKMKQKEGHVKSGDSMILKKKQTAILLKLQKKQHQLIEQLKLQIQKAEKKIHIFSQEEQLIQSKSIQSQKLLNYNQLSSYHQQKDQIKNFVKEQQSYQYSIQKFTDHQINISRAHFHFPLYRDPLNALLNVYVLTNVLGFFNLFIFFQDVELGSRLANLITLLIAFAGMVVVLQQNIKTLGLCITQILVYLIVFTMLVCSVQSLYLNQNDITLTNLEDVFFWICVGISCLNLIVPFLMYAIYKFILKPRYKDFRRLPKIFQQIYLVMPGSKQIDNFLKVYEQIYHPQYRYSLKFQKNIKRQRRNSIQSNISLQLDDLPIKNKEPQILSVLQTIQQRLIIDFMELYNNKDLVKIVEDIKQLCQKFKSYQIIERKQRIKKIQIQKIKQNPLTQNKSNSRLGLA